MTGRDIVPYAHEWQLPPGLSHEVERLAADVPPGTDRLDNPWTFLTHDQRAAPAAERMKSDRAPASPDVIGQWMTDLGLAVPPQDPATLMGRIRMTIRVLGDLPAFCWNEDTLAMAAEAFTHYPAVAELSKLLRPIADRHARQIEVLGRMAMASKGHPTQESTEPYKLPPPPPASKPRLVELTGERPDLNIRPPERTPEEQIRALGLDPKDFVRKTDGAA